ncbi:MAG: EAL domain-containing protein, partial [Methylococcales bacterium]|nr:EAL domain-containing protein [Methylococcales bacterium]
QHFNQLLEVSGNDEISDMAMAFNNLITERKGVEDKLLLSKQVFNETHEGILVTTSSSIIIDANPAFYQITGFSREDVMGKKPNILSSGKQGPRFYADMWDSLIEQGHWQGEVWNRKKSGELYAELLTISALKSKDGVTTYYVGLFTDITKSKQQQKELELIAHYDVLTQLPNRILLADRFTQAISHSKRNRSLLAVCFLDLDDFKPVNDSYGHDVGDQLLIEVAKRIVDNIRDEDTVSRLGGDEFAILLGNLNEIEKCEQTLERIVLSLSQPYLIDQQVINIGSSIGATIFPLDDSDIDTLLRHADQAMYQAKLAGKNGFRLFNTKEDHQAIVKHTQLKEIQQALVNNEFCLFYQPKVNMKTGEAFGVEALIRWQHPEKGIVPPLSFLPVVECTELEIQIGDWVINEALKQLNQWTRQGFKIEVSINIASYHLQSPSFITQLDKALVMYPDVNAENLQLEILESSALGDISAISNIIKASRDALGVQIALDDFGTGYSSLTHLRSLPANTIKIDQSFVRGMLDDPNDYRIIDGVIG